MDEAFLYEDLLGADDDALLGVAFALDDDLLAGEDDDTALMQAVLASPETGAGRAHPRTFGNASGALPATASGASASGVPAGPSH